MSVIYKLMKLVPVEETQVLEAEDPEEPLVTQEGRPAVGSAEVSTQPVAALHTPGLSTIEPEADDVDDQEDDVATRTYRYEAFFRIVSMPILPPDKRPTGNEIAFVTEIPASEVFRTETAITTEQATAMARDAYGDELFARLTGAAGAAINQPGT